MKTCEKITPLLASRSLGLLEKDGEEKLGVHVKGCKECRSFARDLELALGAAKLPKVAPEPSGKEPAGWVKLAARIKREEHAAGTRRWVAGSVGIGVLALFGASVAALWPSPPAKQPEQVAQERPVERAPPPPVEKTPPAPPVPVHKEPIPVPEKPVEPPPVPREAVEEPKPIYGRDVRRKREPEKPAPAIDARVAALQNAEDGSLEVLISVGEDDKVVKGMRFLVYRNLNKVVGEVETVRVQPDSTWCKLISTIPGEKIQQGDLASSKQ